MATPLTLGEEKFSRLMDRYGEGAERVPCPGLMELVEADDEKGEKRYLSTLFEKYPMEEVDAIVLGCTHYVFLRNMIRQMVPEHVAILDGNAGTARQLKRVLEERGLLREGNGGSVELRSSGTEKDLQRMNLLMQRTDRAET